MARAAARSVHHTFPRDGDVQHSRAADAIAGASFDEVPVFDQPQRLELSVDGTPVHVFELHAGSAHEGRGYSGANRRGSMPTGRYVFP